MHDTQTCERKWIVKGAPVMLAVSVANFSFSLYQNVEPPTVSGGHYCAMISEYYWDQPNVMNLGHIWFQHVSPGVCRKTFKENSTFCSYILWGKQVEWIEILSATTGVKSSQWHCSSLIIGWWHFGDHVVVWTQSRGKGDPKKPTSRADFLPLVGMFFLQEDFP